MPCPPLAYFCVRALAKFTDKLSVDRPIQCPLSQLVDEHPVHADPCLWATIAQLVHPLPPHFHDIDLPLSHPDLPLLQRVSDTPNFSLITLLSLPNCTQLRDDSVYQISSLNHLVALDLRGTRISAYALSVLARGLNPSTRTGVWGLRLLSLHSCPNINDDVLVVLQNFPLLSAIDLRFTNCSSALSKAQLSPLGFRPSKHKSLFHPAPLFLALCTLENIAVSASPPISLYSSPLPSVFRVHIDSLHQPSRRTKRTVPVYPASTSPQTTIQTMSFPGDTGTVTFIPPVRESVNKRGSLPSSSISLQYVDPTLTRTVRHNTASSMLDRSITVEDLIHDPLDGREPSIDFFQGRPRRLSISLWDSSSNVELSPRVDGNRDEAHELPSSGYPTSFGPLNPTPRTQPTHQADRPRNMIFPLAAQAIPSLEDGQPESLAIARSPPSWSMLEDRQCAYFQSDRSRKPQPVFRYLDKPVKVDRARLQKRNFAAVANMINKLATKRPEADSEFARGRPPERLPQPRNPFTKSMFAESTASVSELPRFSAQGRSVEGESEILPQVCDSLLFKGPGENDLTRPLRPITTLKPPILPKELVAPLPKPPQAKAELKQTRLAFRDGLGGLTLT